MAENKKQFLAFLSELLAAECIVLGPEAAIGKAKTISGLQIGSKGAVADFDGYGADNVKQLIDAFSEMSGQAAKSIAFEILKKYPEINLSGMLQ